MKRCTIIAVLALMIPAGIAEAGKLYKWVDQEGHVHYGDQPESTARPLDIPPPPPVDEAAQQRRDERDKALKNAEMARAQQTKKQAKKEAADKQREDQCARLKDRLTAYETSHRLFEKDAQGNRRLLTGEERSKATQDTRDQIDKLCNKLP